MSCENEQAVSAYPLILDDFPERQLNQVICPQHLNWLQNAVKALESHLGLGLLPTDPDTNAPYPDVKTMLEKLGSLVQDPSASPTPSPGTDPDPGGGTVVEQKARILGLEVEDVSPTRVRVILNDVELDTGNGDEFMEWNDVSVEVDLSLVGLGGRQADQGPLLPDQWWAVYLLLDSKGEEPPAACAVRATRPEQAVVYPSGYDSKARVACVRVNSASQIVQFMQMENRVYYKDSQSVWTADAATGIWTQAYLGGAVSPYSREAMLMLRITRGGAGGIANMNVRYPGSTGDRGLLSVQTADNGGDSDFASAIVPVDAQGNVEFRVGGSAGTISAEGMVTGYVDRFLLSELQ